MQTAHFLHQPGQSIFVACGMLCMLLASACSDSNNSNLLIIDPPNGGGLTGCADTNSCVSNPPLQVGAERPAQVLIPSDYTTSTRYPLVIVLHGYGASGLVQSAYLGLDTRVDSQQYILVMPDGRRISAGKNSGMRLPPAVHRRFRNSRLMMWPIFAA